MEISSELKKQIRIFQRNEITEHQIYLKLANKIKSDENRKILEKIADEELKHYQDWKEYTGEEIKSNRWKVWFYYGISRLFGFTFGIKLMERGEEDAQENYSLLKGQLKEVDSMVKDESDHEEQLLKMLDEERLRYAGSMVLGLNDALVELTGALAGLTLALQNTRLIALTGLITGISAALSMAASEYLSTKSEDNEKHPVRASLYTGSAYIITVIFLILPYLIFSNYFLCLALTLTVAVLIVAVFNFYISVAKDQVFHKRFIEMAGISLGVALLSFFIGYGVRAVLGVDV